MDEPPKTHEPVIRLPGGDKPILRGAGGSAANPWNVGLGTIGWFTLSLGVIMLAARTDGRDTPAVLLFAIALVTLTGWAVACAHAWEIRNRRPRPGEGGSPSTSPSDR